MAIIGSFATVREQCPRTPAFAAALAYAAEMLREGSPARGRLLALEPGKSARVELEGGAFAMEQAYLTKARPRDSSSRTAATSTSRWSCPAVRSSR